MQFYPFNQINLFLVDLLAMTCPRKKVKQWLMIWIKLQKKKTQMLSYSYPAAFDLVESSLSPFTGAASDVYSSPSTDGNCSIFAPSTT